MDKALGVVRALLAAGAGYLVGKGYLDQGTADQVVGALIIIGTAAWSVISKKSPA
ncbi:MAG: hypothetical protein INF18_00870 [Methylobacterium sp.]|jgi:hypothetical protein|nr:hypothetical protein [Methylobacterium sp.]